MASVSSLANTHPLFGRAWSACPCVTSARAAGRIGSIKKSPGTQSKPSAVGLSHWSGCMMIILNCRSLEKLPKLFADWFAAKGWQPHAHQLAMLAAAQAGVSTLLIAPTGGGKTLAGFLPTLISLGEKPLSGLHT